MLLRKFPMWVLLAWPCRGAHENLHGFVARLTKSLTGISARSCGELGESLSPCLHFDLLREPPTLFVVMFVACFVCSLVVFVRCLFCFARWLFGSVR